MNNNHPILAVLNLDVTLSHQSETVTYERRNITIVLLQLESFSCSDRTNVGEYQCDSSYSLYYIYHIAEKDLMLAWGGFCFFQEIDNAPNGA